MNSKAEQYFPTYRFDKEHRDVVLAELQSALAIASDQSRHYGIMANVLVGLLAVALPILIQTANTEQLVAFLQDHPVWVLFIGAGVSLILLWYFSELQKQIVFNARKVVTLRLMLGLDYGSIHLTLPNWRVEGATNPFAIRLFIGWLSFSSVPYWTLLVADAVLVWLSVSHTTHTGLRPPPIILVWSIVLTWYFRYILLERHETTWLTLVRRMAGLFGLKLVENFEYILYRAKLTVIELDRLKVDYSAMRSILVTIEDKRFYKHKGVDLRALMRAAISRIPVVKKWFNYIPSGGSTIPMQLVRTLFIVHGQAIWKRKLFELLLAPWIVGQFSKPELLNMHIASVRYANGVMGLADGMKHYFGVLDGHRLTPEEAFLLVERLSNISGTVNMSRVHHLAGKVTPPLDSARLTKLYQAIP